jgi:hypothetical protein
MDQVFHVEYEDGGIAIGFNSRFGVSKICDGHSG